MKRHGYMFWRLPYRRVVIWTATSLAVLWFILVQSGVGPVRDFARAKSGDLGLFRSKSGEPDRLKSSQEAADLPKLEPSPGSSYPENIEVNKGIENHKTSSESQPEYSNRLGGVQVAKPRPNSKAPLEAGGSGLEYDDSEEWSSEQPAEDDEVDGLEHPWDTFRWLDGYFNGIRTLVRKVDHTPEFPNAKEVPLAPPPSLSSPTPRQYNEPYESVSRNARACYLDQHNQISVPSIWAFDGIPQHMPDPAYGSYDVLRIKDDVCFDIFGRYGPYGLKHDNSRGGSGRGPETEQDGSSVIWSHSGKIDYANVDWADAQDRCFAANKHLFRESSDDADVMEPRKGEDGKKSRTAVVVRMYTGFEWTDFAVLNFRAMISELSLKSGGEYDVHFLMHVRDDDLPIWSDEATAQRVIDDNVPEEFRGLVTLWSERQMHLYYFQSFEESLTNPSGRDVRDVYRAAHFPLQVFASEHPEYEQFWNWEMDLRLVGNYYELLERIDIWAERQPRDLLWERSERYYVPAYHGSWENFTRMVEDSVKNSNTDAIFGPVHFPNFKTLRFEEQGRHVLPKNCFDDDPDTCGVGEPADFISLNPIFDAADSGWAFGLDASGYGWDFPRRASVVTNARISRRLLLAMHEEVWRHRRRMFPEMFPASIALHHGFKAAYAPHPVYLDRSWMASNGAYIDHWFNGGRDHSTSGEGSPFHLENQHILRGTSYYYDSEFGETLWRRWLWSAQVDRQDGKSVSGNKDLEHGSVDDESGRMCLRSMLLHPIKTE